MPAAFCGIVGLKPTWGLVPYTGIIGLDTSIDHVGPMCRDVHDCALLLECIAGADGLDDRQQLSIVHGKTDYLAKLEVALDTVTPPLEGLRIGILQEGFRLASSDPNVDCCVERAAQSLSSLGATVEPCSLPTHSQAQMIWGVATFMGSFQQAANGNITGRKVVQMTDRVARSHFDQDAFDAAGPGARSMLLSGMHLYHTYGPALYARCKNLLQKLSVSFVSLSFNPKMRFWCPRQNAHLITGTI